MGLLDRNYILEKPDRPFEDIFVPEWEGTIRLRAMTAKEKDQLSSRVDAKGNIDMSDASAFVLVRCIVDENGDRVFTNEDVAALSAKSAAVMTRLFEIAARMNGLTPKGVDDAMGKPVAASTTTPLNGSGSG